MQCHNCGRELTVDHVDGETIVYVCLDPKCTEYRKAHTESGESRITQIKERG